MPRPYTHRMESCNRLALARIMIYLPLSANTCPTIRKRIRISSQMD